MGSLLPTPIQLSPLFQRRFSYNGPRLRFSLRSRAQYPDLDCVISPLLGYTRPADKPVQLGAAHPQPEANRIKAVVLLASGWTAAQVDETRGNGGRRFLFPVRRHELRVNVF